MAAHSLMTSPHLQVAELDAKANEMMMLKFGRVVNLDALEGLGTNKLISELEAKLRGQEKQSDRQQKALEVRELVLLPQMCCT